MFKNSFLACLLAIALLFCFTVPAQSAGVLADTGAASIMNAYFNNSPVPANLLLKLYCTNVTPNANGSDTTATYTVCTGGGYADQTLTLGSWTQTTPGGLAQVAYANQVFTFTGALTTNGTIYGYYVTNAAATILIWSELLGSTFTPANNGDSVTISPLFKMSYGTPVAWMYDLDLGNKLYASHYWQAVGLRRAA